METYLAATLILLHIFTVTQSQRALDVNVNSAECWAVLNTGRRTVPGVSANIFCLSLKTHFGDDVGKEEVLCLRNQTIKLGGR